MTNIFAAMDKPKTASVETDFIGGGGLFDTDIYPATIKVAYFGKSASSKSKSVNLLIDVDGKEVRHTAWVVGKKGTIYDKNGDTLSGYNQIAALCMLMAGKNIGDMDVEEMTQKLYDFDAKKELPQSVDCFTELQGMKIQIALQRQTVDKTKKDDASGDYLPTGEFKDINEIVKFFPEDKRVTISEVEQFIKSLGGNLDETIADGHLLKAINKMPEEQGTYAPKWLESNQGVTYDKSSGKGKAAGKAFSGGDDSSSTTAAKTSSLFDD